MCVCFPSRLFCFDHVKHVRRLVYDFVKITCLSYTALNVKLFERLAAVASHAFPFANISEALSTLCYLQKSIYSVSLVLRPVKGSFFRLTPVYFFISCFFEFFGVIKKFSE